MTSSWEPLEARAISTHSPSANSVVRSMLKYWGTQHETYKLKTKTEYKNEIALFFNNQCAYCFDSFVVWDHVIPMSRESCGLHVWANLVPCCRACNSKKLDKNLISFFEELEITKAERNKRLKKISDHVKNYGGEKVASLPKKQRDYVNASYDEVNKLASKIINDWRKLTINKLNRDKS